MSVSFPQTVLVACPVLSVYLPNLIFCIILSCAQRAFFCYATHIRDYPNDVSNLSTFISYFRTARRWWLGKRVPKITVTLVLIQPIIRCLPLPCFLPLVY